MYKNSKGSCAATPSAPSRGFGTDITNSRPQTQAKNACSTGMVSATLKRARDIEDNRSAVNDLAKRHQQEGSPSERFKSFFGACAAATPAAAATPSRLRQLLSLGSTPTAGSTPQRASIVPSAAAVTPRSNPIASPSPFIAPPPPSSRPDATPMRTPASSTKENARGSYINSVTTDDRLSVLNQQLQATSQANATLQKQVEALRSERKTLKDQLAAKDQTIESVHKQLQDERVRSARLGVDNARLQQELRKLGGGVVAAPSPFAPTPASAAKAHVTLQSSHVTHTLVPPSSSLHPPANAAAPPPPPPPPPAAFSSYRPPPPPPPTLTSKPAAAPPPSKTSSLLSQALSQISSKVGSLKHVTANEQQQRRKSSDPSNWIEAALQQVK